MTSRKIPFTAMDNENKMNGSSISAAAAPLAPMISPEADERHSSIHRRSRRHHHHGHGGGDGSSGSGSGSGSVAESIKMRQQQQLFGNNGDAATTSISTNNKNNRKGKKGRKQSSHNSNVSTMIRERQLDRMGTMMVSPDSRQANTRGGGGAATTTTADQLKTMAGENSTVMALPPMVTPTANTTAPVIGASSSRRTKGVNSTALVFETPQKTPPTAHSSNINTQNTATAASSSNNSHTGVTPFLTSQTPSSQPPSSHPQLPVYSPLTPNTTNYISSHSPFKSSMQILDEKLASLIKLEHGLERRIDGFKGRLYGEEDLDLEGSFDCAGSGLSGGLSGGLRGLGVDKENVAASPVAAVTKGTNKEEDKENKERRPSTTYTASDKVSSSGRSDAVSELSSTETDYYSCSALTPGTSFVQHQGVNSIVGRGRHQIEYHSHNTDDGSAVMIEEGSPPLYRNHAQQHESPLHHHHSRHYGADSHSPPLVRINETPESTRLPRSSSFDGGSSCASSSQQQLQRSASFDGSVASSRTSSNKYKSMHYLMAKEGLRKVHTVGREDGRHEGVAVNSSGRSSSRQVLFSMEDTTLDGDSVNSSMPSELKRVLWAEDTPSRTQQQPLSYYHANQNSFASPPQKMGHEHRHHQIRSNRQQSKSAAAASVDRARSSTMRYPTSANGISKTPTTYPTKRQYHQSHQLHYTQQHHRPGLHHPAGSITPLAPKQLYQSRIDEIELSSSDDEDDNDDDDVEDDDYVGTVKGGSTIEAEAANIIEEQLPLSDANVPPQQKNEPAVGKKNHRTHSVGGMFKWMKGSRKGPLPSSVNAEANIINDASNSINISDSDNNGARLKQQQQAQRLSTENKKKQQPSPSVLSSDDHVSALLQQHADTQHQLHQVSHERTQLLNMLSELRSELTEITRDRDSLIADRDSLIVERDATTKKCQRYKSESKSYSKQVRALSSEVQTLESEMERALRVVQEVQEANASKEEEVNALHRAVKSKEDVCKELQLALASKDHEMEELALVVAKEKEEEWSAKLEAALDDVESKRQVDMQKLTEDLHLQHSQEMDKAKTSHAEQLEQLEVSHQEEVERVLAEKEASLTLALEDRVRQLSSSHAIEMDDLKAELQSSASEEMEQVRLEAEKQRVEDIERVRSDMAASSASALEEQARELSATHTAALDEMRAELLSSSAAEIESVQKEAEKQRVEAIDHVRSEMAASSALALEEKARVLSATHAAALDEMRAELLSSSAAEIERVQKEAERKWVKDIDHVRSEMEASSASALEAQARELSETHAAVLEDQRAELFLTSATEIERVQREAENQRLEELERLKSEMETLSALALEQQAQELSSSHAVALEKLRAESHSSASAEIERVRSEELKQYQQVFASEDLSSSEAVSLESRAETQSSVQVEIDRLQNEAEKQRKEEIDLLRMEMDASSALAPEEHAKKISALHAAAPEMLRDDLQSAGSNVLSDDGCGSSNSLSQSEVYRDSMVGQNDEEEVDDYSSEDESFYVGQEEGFRPSESVQESDISETASESDYDDDNSDLLNESYSADESDTTEVAAKSACTDICEAQEALTLEGRACQRIVDQNCELEEQPSAIATEKVSLLEAMNTSQVEIESLRAKVVNKESCHSSQTSTFKASFDNDVSSVAHQHEKQMNNCDVTNAQTASIPEKNDLTRSLTVDVREESSLLQASQGDMESLLMQVRELEKEKAAVQQHLDDAYAHHGTLSMEVRSLKKSLDAAVVDREAMEVSLRDARHQIDSLDTERTSQLNHIKEVEQQLALYKNEAESLRNEMATHQFEIASIYQQKSKDEQTVRNQIESLNENVLCLQNQLSDTELRLLDMSKSKEDLLEKFLHLVKEKDAMISEKNNLLIDAAEKSALISSLEAQNESLLAENASIVEDISCTEEQRSESIKACMRSQERVCQLEAEVERATLELKEVLQQRDDLVLVKQNLEHKISNMENEHQRLSSSIEDREVNIHSLRDHISSLVLEKEALLEDADHKGLVLESKEDEINKLKKDLMFAESELMDLQDQLINITKEKSKEEEALSQAESEIEFNMSREEELNTSIESLMSEKKFEESSLSSMLSKPESSWVTIAELRANVKHFKSQVDIERKGRSDLIKEKLDVEKQLDIVQEERDHLSFELEGLKDQLSAVALDLKFRSDRIEELEQQIAAKEIDSQNMQEISDLVASRDHFQGLAAKLAISVIKQKMLSKKSKEKRQQKISVLERSLAEVQDDRKTLASKLVEKHEKLIAAAADNRLLFDTLRLHEKEFEEASEMQLESITPSPLHEQTPPSSIPAHTLKRMVSKLALTLVTLKAREINSAKDNSTLEKQIVDHQKMSERTQNDLKIALGGKAELKNQLTKLSNENDTLQKNHQTLVETVTKLEESVTAKDEELQELHTMFHNVSQQNEQLANEIAKMTNDLQSKEEKEHHILRAEREIAAKLKDQLDQKEDALLDLQAAKLLVENRLEEVLQDKSHLSSEVASMHDNVAMLEAELQVCQDKIAQSSNEVTLLENQAKSNEQHIFSIESQLASRVDEAEVLNSTAHSHETTLDELRKQMHALDEQKVQIEGALTSLHSKMDGVMNERDSLALQLDTAVKELESIREERNSLASRVRDISIVQNLFDHSISAVDVADSELESSPDRYSFIDSPLREIMNSSCISEKDVDRVCEKMGKAQIIIAKVEQERKLLKKEVKLLRAGLEQTQGELAMAKKDYNNVSRQTLALRDVVSQARTLLEKTEKEKHQLALDLENAQKAVKRIQKNSTQSYNAIVSQSKNEINKLKMELKDKNESIKFLMSLNLEKTPGIIERRDNQTPNKISKYDISSAPLQRDECDEFNTPARVTSKKKRALRDSGASKSLLQFQMFKKTRRH